MTLLDGPKIVPTDALEQRVRDMAAVRQMAARIVAGRDGRAPAALTDQEWFALCAYARGAHSDNVAVARVVKAAGSLHKTDGSNTGSESPKERTTVAPGPILPIGTMPLEVLGVPDVSQGLVDLIPPDFGAPQVEDAPIRDLVQDPTPGSHSAHSDRRVSGVPPHPRGAHRHRRRTPRLGVRPLDDRRRERWLTIASWVRNFGLIILLFVAWQLWGTDISQHHTQEALKRQFQAKVTHVTTKPSPTFTLTPATTRIADPPDGQVMAMVQIPAIGLSQFVVSGTNESDLAKGPGHYLGTAMPGQAGNVAIAGHRTTHGAPFNRLAELSVGDPIYLTTLTGQRLTYVVSATPVAVSPRDVTVLNNFGDNRLTLTTCNPEYSAVQRLIVVAAYLPPGQSHPQPISKVPGKPYVLAGTYGDGWNLSALPLALLFAGLLVALGVFFRPLSRTYGRQVRWLILVPVWLALLLALFETLANALPASV